MDLPSYTAIGLCSYWGSYGDYDQLWSPCWQLQCTIIQGANYMATRTMLAILVYVFWWVFPDVGEKIGSHVLGRTINKLNRAFFDRVADEMPPDIDMFSLGVKLPLQMSECNSGLVIWVKNDQVFEWSKDFTKKALKPNKFLGCVHRSYVFCFGCW